MTDDCKLSPAEREAFRQRLDRKPPHDEYRPWFKSSWRDFTAEPCPAGCSQGRVAVPVRDGTFGWVMASCGRCGNGSVSAVMASGTTNDTKGDP